MNTIIIRRALLKRWCWNWQTGMVEGHVSQDVEVQVLSSALNEAKIPEDFGDFYFIFSWVTERLILKDQTATGDRAFGFGQFIHDHRFDRIAAFRKFCGGLRE